MPFYDLCFINEPMGYFERIETFDALNDEVAISIARRGRSGHSVELWSGGRLVERFDRLHAEPREPAASPDESKVAAA